MKKIIILIVAILFTSSVFAKVSDKKMNQRKKMAEELISSDEGYLEDYFGDLTDDQMTYFFKLSFKMADEVAMQTANIEDDNKAYDYIENGIDGNGGVKDQIKLKIRSFEKGSYKLTEVKVNPEFLNISKKMLYNISMVKLQQKLSSI